MWAVETTVAFDEWFASLGEVEKEEIDGLVGVPKVVGPQLRRPYADASIKKAHDAKKSLDEKKGKAK
jgi:hypothetical protein